MENLVREAIRCLQIPKEAEPILRNLARGRPWMAASREGKKAVNTIRGLESQLARSKRLFVIGDYTEEQYEKEKS